MITSRLPAIFYGADYNPEQWPEDVWLDDMRLMRQAGVNLVSIGIFSWARLQSAPDRFHFEWLDRLMDLLAAHEIAADLATATASPPAWLTRLHPSVLPELADGTRYWPGARQAYNPSSQAYRDACATLVRALATRYAGHPALAMWHVNNEYACHVAADYGDESAAAFRRWLQSRYGTLDELNAHWGTAFWSQHYYDWAEILPPRQTATYGNPGQMLDFQRFSSDQVLDCFRLEKNILREITPDLPITTNFMGAFKPLDYVTWARELDFVSWDSYPEPREDPAHAAGQHDLMRSLGGGKPFVLMEQVTTQVNWRDRNRLKPPGHMRLLSYQAVAHGADGILFFQWRQSRAGAEKYHGSMVGHRGDDTQRCFRESAELGQELSQLAELVDTRVRADVGILFDYENWWALELPSKPNADVRYLEQIGHFTEALFAANVATDFVFAATDFAAYRVIVAPALYLLDTTLATKLEEFVSAGGTLVVSFFSGIVDPSDRVHLGGYPGPLRRLLGVEVEEFECLYADRPNRLATTHEGLAPQYEATLWADVLRSEGAEVLATFQEDFLAGRPAVTRNAHGTGTAYYVGTASEPAFYRDLLAGILRDQAITGPLTAPAGVELTVRHGDGASYLFVLNHNEDPVELNDPALVGHDLLTGSDVTATLRLEPKAVAIIRRPSHLAT